MEEMLAQFCTVWPCFVPFGPAWSRSTLFDLIWPFWTHLTLFCPVFEKQKIFCIRIGPFMSTLGVIFNVNFCSWPYKIPL